MNCSEHINSSQKVLYLLCTRCLICMPKHFGMVQIQVQIFSVDKGACKMAMNYRHYAGILPVFGGNKSSANPTHNISKNMDIM